MKISKAKLRQIIKEELAEGRGGSVEEALGEYLRMRQDNDPASVDALVKFMGQNRRTFENIITDLTNKLNLAPVEDKGPRLTSTGPWAPEYRDN